MGEYEEQLEVIKDADDSLFPNWLFNPVFNEFNDNYYTRSFADDELTTIVKKLRRRYNDFFDWAEATEIYNEYMEKLAEKYGSMRVIKNALEVDMMDDPVPSKPRLKNTRKNRQFLRSGVIPSRRVIDVPVTNDDMLAIARQAYPDSMGEEIDEAENLKKVPKDQRKRLKKMQENLAGKSRRRNLYRSIGDNAGTDFIVEYLNQARKGVYDSSGRKAGDADRSLHEIVKENEKIANTLPELLEEEMDNSTTIKNGRLVRKSDDQRMEIYKELYQEGIDILGKLGKSMSKKSVKMIRTQIGAVEPASKKELKKIKKRNKKDMERIQRRKDADDILEKTLLGNKLNVTRDDQGNLNLRLRDLYQD